MQSRQGQSQDTQPEPRNIEHPPLEIDFFSMSDHALGVTVARLSKVTVHFYNGEETEERGREVDYRYATASI